MQMKIVSVQNVISWIFVWIGDGGYLVIVLQLDSCCYLEWSVCHANENRIDAECYFMDPVWIGDGEYLVIVLQLDSCCYLEWSVCHANENRIDAECCFMDPVWIGDGEYLLIVHRLDSRCYLEWSVCHANENQSAVEHATGITGTENFTVHPEESFLTCLISPRMYAITVVLYIMCRCRVLFHGSLFGLVMEDIW
ncbi:unnamed protein product [Calicophoron daubneyi]|uniref:Uncharacterized protein n=1 Tax=Calicophoron daubneyi TaxID=300641 RepID=A0AAV2TT00_CALDB